MGAWIEILITLLIIGGIWVAPFVGAWIEIPSNEPLPFLLRVAPFVGAWIEMEHASPDMQAKMSHPSWVRGLKYLCMIPALMIPMVAPFVGAWIEMYQRE